MKTCTKCHEEKDFSKYSKKSAASDGICPACKDCLNAQSRQYRKDNADAIVQRQQDYYQSPKGKACAARAYEVMRKKHPLKYKARSDLNHAVEAGNLTRKACEVCGDCKSEGHHDDYNKPLEVKWLCRKHHRELHRGDS